MRMRCSVSAMKASFSTSYSGNFSMSSMLNSVWYSLGVLSGQNLILDPSAEGSAAMPYSIHQEGTKMMSGNSWWILRCDWNQSSGSR